MQLETGSYGPRPKLIDPYEEYITRRLNEYPELSAHQLYDEIKEMGFEGSERTVRRHIGTHRVLFLIHPYFYIGYGFLVQPYPHRVFTQLLDWFLDFDALFINIHLIPGFYGISNLLGGNGAK
jgi:hypothetical protein